ncbi:uncharacterized protein LOC125232677 [Leguminivora glycinivorella]|uniref:uncharacterized protein LOC125232677 n=1 Tax=Leguminivora glycinivorella TaxID=1035111 RepID=UPI00200CA0C9|nr:uncharacterized protein LOC125232677 [Leguminivora glycinivorella]
MMAKAGTNYPDQDKDKNPPRTDKLKAIDSTSSNDFAVSGPSEVNEYKTIDGTKVNVTVMNEESKEISIIGRNVNLESGTTDCRTLDCGKVEGCSVEGNRSTGNVVPGTHGKNMETQNK